MIDCGKCKFFTGDRLRFSCSKGHEAVSQYSFKRDKCRDNKAKTTPELIVDKYHWNAKFYGDTEIKKRRADVRRAVTTLKKAISSFSEILPDEDEAAILRAVQVLGQLGNDLEKAGQLAIRVKKENDLVQKRKDEEQQDKVAAEFIDATTKEELIRFATDLADFDKDGTAWLAAKGDERTVFLNDAYRLRAAAQGLSQGRTTETVLSRLIAAELIYLSTNTHIKIADFKRWRSEKVKGS